MGLVKPVSPVFQSSHPLARGLVATFPFFEGAGPNLYDLSGNQNSLTVPTGSPAWVGGGFGSALSFGGSDQYSNSAINLPVGASAAWTFGAWINTAADTSLSCPMAFGVQLPNSTSFGQQRGLLQFNGHYYFWGQNADWDTGVALDLDGSWHRIVFTTAGGSTTPTINLYRDGKLAASGTPGAAFTTAGAFLSLGSKHSAAATLFVGKLDGFFVANRQWSAVDAALDYFDPFAIYRKPSRWWDLPFGVAPATSAILGWSDPDLAVRSWFDPEASAASGLAWFDKEWVPSPLSLDGPAAIEIISTQLADRTVPLESLATTAGSVTADGLVQLEIIATQRLDGNVPLEDLATVSADRAVLVEFLATARSDGSAPLEGIATAARDGAIPIEAAATARRDGMAPAEFTATQQRDGGAPLETVATARADGGMPLEAVGTIRGDGALPFELLATASRDGATPVEMLATARRDGAMPVEWAGLISVTADGLMPIEFSAQMAAQAAVAIESLGSIVADRRLAGEFLLGVVRDGSLPAENVGAIVRSGQAPIEFSSLVLIDQKAAVEFLSTVRADGSLPSESIAKVLADGQVPIEDLATTFSVTADGLILIEWDRLLKVIGFVSVTRERISGAGVGGEGVAVAGVRGESIEE